MTEANRKISVIGLGGTIAMAPAARGLVPQTTVADMLAAIPCIERLGDLSPIDFCCTASPNLTFDHMRDLSRLIEAETNKGQDAIVVVQGTDSLEETAFAIELLTDTDIPIIFTGALRAATQLGSDGPRNLASAILAASKMDQGVWTVFNDEVHAARSVQKTHTTALAAFRSPNDGPATYLHDGKLYHKACTLPRLPVLDVDTELAWPRVAIITIGMDENESLLSALPDLGYRGCVLQAMGGGHVPVALVDVIENLTRHMPVVLCSRAYAGPVLENTYGYPGSETDLIARGVLPGGNLHSLKARVLLTLALAANPETAVTDFKAITTLI